MSIEPFLLELKNLEINVQLIDGKLNIAGPRTIITPELLDKIKLRKPEIINFFNSVSFKKDNTIDSIIKSESSNYDVSNGQRRLWILDQLNPGLCAYNLSKVFKLNGRLEVEILTKSIKLIIDKHEILRSIFVEKNGFVQQNVLDISEADFRIDIHNITNSIEIEKILKDSILIPFNLAKYPLLKISLFRISENEYLLLFNIHHIIFDGWSENIFLNELISNYNSLIKGLVIEDSQNQLQYKDYAAWHKVSYSRGELLKEKEYWNKLFRVLPDHINLPCDFSKPKINTFQGSSLTLEIDKIIKEKLLKVGSKNKASLFTCLLSLVNIFIYKISNSKDLVIGIPVAGRDLNILYNQIGFYVNTIALRTYIKGFESFQDILEKTKLNMLEGLENQKYPFDFLIEDLKITTLSENPLFNIMVVLQEASNSENKINLMESLSIEDYKLPSFTSKFDLTFEFIEKLDGLNLCIEYNTDLFKPSTIERLARYFNNLVESILIDPNLPIDGYNLIGATEQDALINNLNQINVNKLDRENFNPLHSYFINTVENYSNKTAVIIEEEKFTFDEVSKLSNNISNYLKNCNVNKGDIVAIYFNRSIELIGTIWGIINIGAAYLPIDINWPIERINKILIDSKPKMILGGNDFNIDLLKFGFPFVSVKSIQEFKSDQIKFSDGVINDLVNVIYTSGSTGQPKGVMVEQQSILNRLIWGINYFNLSKNDVILFKTPYTFDVSIPEIFLGGITGCSVCILPSGQEANSKLIVDLIYRYKVTTIHFVPSMLASFLDYIESIDISLLSSLKRVLSSGEALSMTLVNRFNSILFLNNKTELFNLYGPTEAAVEVTYFNCSPIVRGIVPIGKPIDNIKLYILNEHLNLQPIGIIGELYISGVGVARGYINNSELTKLKFIPDPFSKGNIMYKTGDLARWLEDGNIEYFGRMDQQVKIRGFRIELGEIEENLRMFDGVKDCVVIVKIISEINKQLIAYIVSDKAISTLQIRKFLKTTLPEYLIPVHFIQIENLPLNSSGKANRKFLESLDINRVDNENEFVLPIKSLEIKIADIWKRVLLVEKVSMKDDFFNLGGNSLLLIKLISIIKHEINVELTIYDFINQKLDYIVEKCEKAIRR